MPETVGPFAEGSRYEANEVDALRWVYATLVDSALLAYELVLPALTSAEREQYYAESRTTAALFGIPPEELPGNWQHFEQYFESMLQSNTLTVSSAAREMAHEASERRGVMVAASVLVSRTDDALAAGRGLREEFHLAYGEREQRSAARAVRWLPQVYRGSSGSVRFVGPYREALGQAARQVPPGPGGEAEQPAMDWPTDAFLAGVER